jgi:hypothetical protein
MIPSPRVLLLTSLLALVAACSPNLTPTSMPSPTPTPTPTVTLAAAAEAYSAFARSWRSRYAGVLNEAAAAADADSANVARYARVLAEGYAAYSDGLAQVEVPDTLRAALDREIESLDVLVALARQLAADPSDIDLKTQTQAALGRVTESSAAVESALDVSP